MLRDLAVDAARLDGFGDDAASYAATVACGLAALLANADFASPGGGTLDFTCRPHDDGLLLTVHDDGPPFDPAQGGRAEQFAHALLHSDSRDWIAYRNRGRGGREICAMLHAAGAEAEAGAATPSSDVPADVEDDEHSLVVRASEPSGAWLGRIPAEFTAAAGSGAAVPQGTAEHTGAASAAAGADGARGAAGTGDRLEFMLLRPEQAAAVGRCIYDAYRLTYFDELFYRSAVLAELNRSGEMVSAVAVGGDGEVVGHVALEFSPGERAIADVAAAVTRRSARGHKVAERLFALLIGEARRRGMSAVWCDAVTVHPFTQRLAHGLGFVPCGFHLAFETAATHFVGISDHPAHRGSSVVMFRTLGGISAAPLDVPEQHRDLLADIYVRLAAPRRLDVRAPGGARAGRSAMAVLRHDFLELVRLTISQPGEDLPDRVRTEIRAATDHGVKVVEARLNLQAPGAAAAGRELEDLGFFVTGLLPAGPEADWLLLQRCSGVLVDYDGMVVDAPGSEELLARIRANDPDAG